MRCTATLPTTHCDGFAEIHYFVVLHNCLPTSHDPEFGLLMSYVSAWCCDVCTGRVVAFMEEQVPADRNPYGNRSSNNGWQTRLASHLDSQNVLTWLQVFSFCGLDAQAQECIAYATGSGRQQVLRKPLTMSYLSELQAVYAEKLLASLATSA